MSAKEGPELSIEAIKEVVKKLKNQSFESLTHHDLAIALSTVGFNQVCKQFGTSWKYEKEALKILDNSDYDLSWYGRTNSTKFNSLLPLCARGDIEKVKELLSTVGSENKRQVFTTVDNLKRSALHIAVKQGYDILAEYLISFGFPCQARDRQLKTPLHYCNNQLICQTLVNKKAKVVVKDNKMCTPVHYAASGAEYKCLEILLKAANVVNDRDSTGKTALFYAIYNTSEEQVNIIRILLENGAKINEQDIYGRTALHYAVEVAKSRCIPILLRKGASIDIRDKHGKTALDLAQKHEKIRKILRDYCNNKGVIFDEQQESKRKQFKEIQQSNKNMGASLIGSMKQNASKVKTSGIKKGAESNPNSQIYTKDINQVSTWVREKFFVLMKKLQQSGVKALWHLKRPYVYTGSWAEDIESLQDLYETFLGLSGPEAAMRAFNILCPYQKPLPTVLSKSEEAFQSFFGENWFSNDPIQKVRNMHSSSKIKNQLELKMKQIEALQTQILGYRSEIEALESKVINLNQEISHYKKVEDDLRREKSKNTTQYTQLLKYMSQNQQLKNQINSIIGSQQKTKILSNLNAELRTKNQDLMKEIEQIKMTEAASRRKCGRIFLKSLRNNNQTLSTLEEGNLYDDDSIISLYNLLKSNPPNLEKRFKMADKRGNNKLTVQEFTLMLEDLSMLPQDVMSMHRITGFAAGRKTLSLEEFKTILQCRHKNRPMWQKKLIRKLKNIILESGMVLEKFFSLIDQDGNGTIELPELRKGLESYNIFMNQNDWSNLFNLLDSDNSGCIDLIELKSLMDQERTGKLEQVSLDSQDQQPPGSSKIIAPGKNVQGQDQQENGQEQAGQEEEPEQNEQDIQQKQQKEEQVVQNQQQNAEEEQEFSQPYQQKDSDEQNGITKLNGTFKLQLPAIKIAKGLEENAQKIYARFHIKDDIYSDDSIKMINLSQKKQDIAVEFKLIEYKVEDLDEFSLKLSFWKTRNMDNEEDYLGEVHAQLKEVLDAPQEWVKKKLDISADEYEKEVGGKVALQLKWTPEDS